MAVLVTESVVLINSLPVILIIRITYLKVVMLCTSWGSLFPLWGERLQQQGWKRFGLASPNLHFFLYACCGFVPKTFKFQVVMSDYHSDLHGKSDMDHILSEKKIHQHIKHGWDFSKKLKLKCDCKESIIVDIESCHIYTYKYIYTYICIYMTYI